MARKYKNHAPELKLKVAMEGVRNEKTVNQIASEYAILPTLVVEWKKQLITEGVSIFQNKRIIKTIEAHEDPEYLQQQIGRLTAQIELLKKKQGIAH